MTSEGMQRRAERWRKALDAFRKVERVKELIERWERDADISAEGAGSGPYLDFPEIEMLRTCARDLRRALGLPLPLRYLDENEDDRRKSDG